MASVPRIVTVELLPGAVTGATPEYISSQGLTTGATATPASTSFMSRLKSVISYTRNVNCVVWGKEKSSGTLGAIDIINTDRKLDRWLADVWRDREVVMKRGLQTDNYEDFIELARAVIDKLSAPDWYTMRLGIRDKGALLDAALQQDQYPYLVFAPSLEGTPRPICIGECEGVPLTQVNSAQLQYDVHDDVPFSIDEVTDEGVILNEYPANPDGEWELDVSSDVHGIKRVSNPVQNGKQVAKVRGAQSGSVLIERLPDVIQYLLGRSVVDPADVDTYSIDALDLALPFKLCLYDRSGIQISQALTQFLDSFLGWWYFDREGKLRVGRLEEPTGDPSFEITERNLIGGFTPTFDEAKGLSDTVAYARNWSPHKDGEVAGSVYAYEPTRAQRIISPYQTKKGVYLLHRSYRHAVGAPPIMTLLSDPDDAQALADYATLLYQQERYFYSGEVRLDIDFAYTLEPGAVCLVTLDCFGFNAGRKLLVKQVTTDPLSGRTGLVLWGAAPESGDF